MASTKVRTNVCICLMFGLPGSGKSSLADILCNQCSTSISTKGTISGATTSQQPSDDGPGSVLWKTSRAFESLQKLPTLIQRNVLHLEYDNLLPLPPIPTTQTATLATVTTLTTADDEVEIIVAENKDECVHSDRTSPYSTDKFMDTGWWKQERMQVVKLVDAFIKHLMDADSNTSFYDERPTNVSDTVWTTFLSLVMPSLDCKREDTDVPQSVVLMIDDNLYLHSMRYEYFKLARQYGCGFCQVFMDCPPSLAIKRNFSRSKDAQVPEEVILKMANKLERHDNQKFHWEDLTCHVDASQPLEMDAIVSLLHKALSSPVEPTHETDMEEVARSRLECSASVFHQIDLILRKCISTYVSEGRRSWSTNQLRQIGKRMPRLKEQIIQDFKDGKYSTILMNQQSFIQDASQDSTSHLHLFVKEVFSKAAKEAIIDLA